MRDLLSRYKLFLILSSVLIVIFITGCGTESENGQALEQNEEKSDEGASEKSEYPTDVDKNPLVTIKMENNDEIMIELYPKIAPNTVANFVSFWLRKDFMMA